MFELRDYQQAAHNAALNYLKYRGGVNGYVVAPGGSGKSVMIAKLAEAASDMGKRVIILARSEKLLRQNAAKLSHPYGIYCAGLGSHDASQQITVASIQSIINCKDVQADICICDEAHNIHQNPESETQYWNFFRRIGTPQIIGYTATAFRTGSGTLQWGEEIVNIPLGPLIEREFIVPPVNKCVNAPDLSGVTIKMGEYVESQLEDIFTTPEQLTESVRKIAEYSARANSVLIFTLNRYHSEMLKRTMIANDMPAICVDGETPKPELAKILEDFESYQFKYLINCNLLTEGYDAPQLDMVVILRATISKVLFEQMAYRGTRPYPGKDKFLLLDMGGNLQRHGALGSPCYYKQKGEVDKKVGKICPECEAFIEGAGIRECPDCGYEFPEGEKHKVNHDIYADGDSATVHSKTIEYSVRDVLYREHKNKQGKLSLRVDYVCAAKYGAISEWYSPHHENEWVRGKMVKFLKDRDYHLPFMEDEIASYSLDDLIFHCQKLKKPTKIVVDQSEKFPRIIRYVWDEKVQTSNKVLGEDCIPW